MDKKQITRTPYWIVFTEQASFKDTYGGAENVVALSATLIRPEQDSDTVLLSMHPVGGTGSLPVMKQFAAAGIHVLACDSRYRGCDQALIMEKVVMDMGAAVRYARDRLGYSNVVLLGWSGGGALSAYYQSQAEAPTVTDSPGGDGPDLTKAGLMPADFVVMMAAHVSRHGTMTEWMDASILNEADPETRDSSLDIYSGSIQPPFEAEFVARYRAAQIARNRRITAWVKAKLHHLRQTGRPHEEFAFVTHGTMADPRWLDPSLDANDRKPGYCYLGDPRIVNMSPVGLARFSTLRSWLSQWSYDDALGDGPACLAKIGKPILVINNTGDDACTPSHAHRLYDAISHEDKCYTEIKGANHYYQGQPELADQAISEVRNWLADKGLTI